MAAGKSILTVSPRPQGEEPQHGEHGLNIGMSDFTRDFRNSARDGGLVVAEKAVLLCILEQRNSHSHTW
jgi:hypothetical protein